jgi:hypothetical protein
VSAGILNGPDDALLHNDINNVAPLPVLSAQSVDDFFATPPSNNITTLNSVFPLPGHLFKKWKDGVRLWPTKAISIMPYCGRHESEATDTIVKRFLEAGIISHTRKGPFRSNIFLVSKNENKVRPVIDYSHLTEFLPCPRMVLSNLSQLVTRKSWKPNLWYVKLDFKNAFFNINIHEKSKHITTFLYKKCYFKFNVLPFGFSIAPHVMQAHLNCILNYIRQFTEYSWGHIDDIVLAHEDRLVLEELVRDLLEMLTKVR